eukprot:9756366-Ditylum_brightwellii.AAC.1
MVPRFKCHVVPSAPGHGFNAFETAWNQEAGQRVVESLTAGDESIIPFTTRQQNSFRSTMTECSNNKQHPIQLLTLPKL